MDVFAKKLKDHGMKIYPLSQSTHRAEETPLKIIGEMMDDGMDADLYTLITSYVDIFIEDHALFIQSFDVPRKWEKIYDGVFTRISLEMDVGDIPELYNNADGYEIENWINDKICENEKEFIKMEKTYRLRKKFKPNGLIREMAQQQGVWVEQFIEEMKGNEKLNHLVKELSEMIEEASGYAAYKN